MIRICAQNYSTFKVRGRNSFFEVIIKGLENASCSCPNGKLCGTCKHTEWVFNNACLWNPGFYFHKSGNAHPIKYDEGKNGFNKEDKCPECNGPTVLMEVAAMVNNG